MFNVFPTRLARRRDVQHLLPEVLDQRGLVAGAGDDTARAHLGFIHTH